MESLLIQVLNEAIHNEHSAAVKYKKYAKIAHDEGFINVAYLFRSLVYAENIHIKNHQRAMGKNLPLKEDNLEKITSNSEKNLEKSVQNENWEHNTMYPSFRKRIKKSIKSKSTSYQAKVANLSFEWAEAVELTHAQVLKLALNSVLEGHDWKVETIYVCEVCGNLRLEPSDKVCPVCGHDATFYRAIFREEK